MQLVLDRCDVAIRTPINGGFHVRVGESQRTVAIAHGSEWSCHVTKDEVSPFVVVLEKEEEFTCCQHADEETPANLP